MLHIIYRLPSLGWQVMWRLPPLHCALGQGRCLLLSKGWTAGELDPVVCTGPGMPSLPQLAHMPQAPTALTQARGARASSLHEQLSHVGDRDSISSHSHGCTQMLTAGHCMFRWLA